MLGVLREICFVRLTLLFPFHAFLLFGQITDLSQPNPKNNVV